MIDIVKSVKSCTNNNKIHTMIFSGSNIYYLETVSLFTCFQTKFRKNEFLQIMCQLQQKLSYTKKV